MRELLDARINEIGTAVPALLALREPLVQTRRAAAEDATADAAVRVIIKSARRR